MPSGSPNRILIDAFLLPLELGMYENEGVYGLSIKAPHPYPLPEGEGERAQKDTPMEC